MELDLAIVRNAVNVDATSSMVADARAGKADRWATRTRAGQLRIAAGYVVEQSKALRRSR